ncbi:hypothetical protein BDR03DRAFT_935950 [Suillus americanus]|nr:hypothetical protein BDR03DRAFT_935950 [Suillus americanus]
MRNTPTLKGYTIPGLQDKIIGDKYDDLQDILNDWCLTSGAKFNLEKTEILPIGSKEFRTSVIENKKMNEIDTPSLGAWIGNDLNEITPWEPILDKIETHLQRWSTGHPTLDGKRHIIQMFVGGMTQFLSKAQGMPKNVESTLTKSIRQFI